MFTVFSCSNSVNEEDPPNKDTNTDVSNTPNTGDSTTNVSNTPNTDNNTTAVSNIPPSYRLYTTGSGLSCFLETIDILNLNNEPIEHLKLPDIKEFCIYKIKEKNNPKYPNSFTAVNFRGGYFNTYDNDESIQVIVDSDEKLNNIKDKILTSLKQQDPPQVVSTNSALKVYKHTITLLATCNISYSIYMP